MPQAERHGPQMLLQMWLWGAWSNYIKTQRKPTQLKEKTIVIKMTDMLKQLKLEGTKRSVSPHFSFLFFFFKWKY